MLYAEDHPEMQRAVGRLLRVAGASVTIAESALSGDALAALVRDLLGDRPRLVAMGESARSFARPDAAKLLADLLFEAEGTR